MDIEIKEIYFGTPEYAEELALRNEVLRKPLGMNLYDQDLSAEKNYIRIAAFINNFDKKDHGEKKIAGTLLLVPKDKEVIQMKQMAVDESFRGWDIGTKIIKFAEDLISKKGYKKIVFNARKVALPFYLKAGYEIEGEEFEEVGIPHFKMKKELNK